MSDQLQAVRLGLQILSAIGDNIIFAAAFHHHTTKGVDYAEALEHTLDSLVYTRNRIPAYISEKKSSDNKKD